MPKNVQQKVANFAKKQSLEQNPPHRINSKAASIMWGGAEVPLL
jgi:hypothetical protein